MGQIVYIPQDAKYNRYVISQSQFRIRCNKRVLPEFLVFYFHTRTGQHKILSNASQVGVPALARPSTTFQQIEIELPDLDIQEKIVSILCAFNNKIELNNKINANLQQQAQAIFKSWFVDFEPWGGHKPEDWKEVTLSDCCSLISRGITPKYDDNSEQIVLNQKCIRNQQIDFTKSRTHLPKKINEKWLQFGDILINSTGQGTLGRMAQVYFQPENMTVDSHITIVRPKRDILTFYLGCLLINKEYEFVEMERGSTGQTELPRESIQKYEVLLPDEKILKQFNDVVYPMFRFLIKNQKESLQLEVVRDTLLPKLMNGEVKTNE